MPHTAGRLDTAAYPLNLHDGSTLRCAADRRLARSPLCPRPDVRRPQRERLERIDLYQHHFPSRRVSIPRLMESMADAVDGGKIRAVGVSNYSAEQMRLAHKVLADRGIPLASNQVQYSLLHRRPEADGPAAPAKEVDAPGHQHQKREHHQRRPLARLGNRNGIAG